MDCDVQVSQCDDFLDVDQEVLAECAAVKLAVDFGALEADWLLLPHDALWWVDLLAAVWHSALEAAWAVAAAESEDVFILAWLGAFLACLQEGRLWAQINVWCLWLHALRSHDLWRHLCLHWWRHHS